MSDRYNTLLLERTAEVLDTASKYAEEFHDTTAGKILDGRVAQVIKHIDDNNLDDLYNYSLPALENAINEASNALADQAKEDLYGYDMVPTKEWDEVA